MCKPVPGFWDPHAKILIDTYHPSRQNTNTGKLIQAMFLKIFKDAVRFAEAVNGTGLDLT